MSRDQGASTTNRKLFIVIVRGNGMALKDWKRIGLSTWLKKGRTFRVRGIQMHEDKMVSVDKNTSGKYNVILAKGSTGARTLKGMFKTKSAALKFAMAYMRSH